jgi:hypothetical protein
MLESLKALYPELDGEGVVVQAFNDGLISLDEMASLIIETGYVSNIPDSEFVAYVF